MLKTYEDFRKELTEHYDEGSEFRIMDTINDIRSEIKDWEDELDRVKRNSTWEYPETKEKQRIRDEIGSLEWLIGAIREYLKKDDIEIKRYYVYSENDGTKHYDDYNDFWDNVVDYLKTLSNTGYVSIGAEYIRETGGLGASDFVVRNSLTGKYEYSEDIQKVFIKVPNDFNYVLEEILEEMNK